MSANVLPRSSSPTQKSSSNSNNIKFKRARHDVITQTVTTPLESNRRSKRQMGEDSRKKRKKRTIGHFACDYEGCTKSFTRAEHLSRHKLNHNPAVIYKCGWVGCDKTFVRSDLKDRHLRRHAARLKKQEELKQLEIKSKKNLLFKGMGTLTFNNLNLDNIKPSTDSQSSSVDLSSSKPISSAISEQLPIENDQTFFNNGASMTVMNLNSSDGSKNSGEILTSESESEESNDSSEDEQSSWEKHQQQQKRQHQQQQQPLLPNTNISETNSGSFDVNHLSTSHSSLTLELKRSGSLFDNKVMYHSKYPESQSKRQQQQQKSQHQEFSEQQQANVISALSGNIMNPQIISSSSSSSAAAAAAAAAAQQMNLSNSFNSVSPDVNSNIAAVPLTTNLSNQNQVQPPRIAVSNPNSLFDIFNNDGPVPSNGSIPKQIDLKAFSNIPNSPSDITSWIDSNLISNLNDVNFNAFDGQNMLNYGNDNSFFFGLSPNTYINEIFKSMMPQLVNNDDHQEYAISTETVTRLVLAVPALAENPDANVAVFQRCLQIYWQLFHVQFPFLHRPSFVANDAPALLLLSMIMLGAGLVFSTGRNEYEYITHPRNLADTICVPLRWRLFELGDFEVPVKTWVIQSLLILEYYEKFFTSRNLHERTYVHHGAIIQLLRRSPTLGGNPMKTNHGDVQEDVTDEHLIHGSEDFTGKSEAEKRTILWNKWIDFESLKRTTLMAFYIDSTHSVIFGHLGILYAHQIQVQMPCDDDLWESNGYNFDLPSADLKPRPFLQELRSLLKSQPVRTGVFGKRILMSGLLAIIFQLQQRDLQTSALGWEKGKEDSWKEYFSYILDYLTHDCVYGCCDTKSAVLISPSEEENLAEPSGENSLKSYFAKNDTRCKYPAYHIAQIIMRISHYDLVIFAGAPWRMNVPPKSTDYELVKSRVENWANSTSGKLTVLHALLYLFEMFLTPQNFNYDKLKPALKNYKYECLNDPIVERSYAMYIATLAVWAYCFTVEGPESNILANANEQRLPTNTNFIPEAEDGYSFLRRIRNELSSRTNTVLHSIPASDAFSFHRITLIQANFLPQIKNKKNITGLLRVVGISLGKSNWHLAREFSLLFKHCAERSLGLPIVHCYDYA